MFTFLLDSAGDIEGQAREFQNGRPEEAQAALKYDEALDHLVALSRSCRAAAAERSAMFGEESARASRRLPGRGPADRRAGQVEGDVGDSRTSGRFSAIWVKILSGKATETVLRHGHEALSSGAGKDRGSLEWRGRAQADRNRAA